MVSKFVAILIFLCHILAVACVGESRGPKLVVFLVVDQMRNDYLDRFTDLYEGGFRYLLDNGLRLTETYHEHAYTATAAGHLVLASGVFPGTAGIISNSWYVRKVKEMVYCVADENARPLSGSGPAVSYENVNASALGDWIKSSYPRSKVFAVSSKDRSAILLGGKNPDGVFWFDSNAGEFVSSDYYMEEYPEWFRELNREKTIDNYVGKTWMRLLADESVYVERSREDEYPPEGSGEGEGDGSTFPHHYPVETGEEPVHYWALWGTPWLDALTLELAETVILKADLGKDEYPDLLGVALSAADGVGHRYGPFSQETMDMFLRLDKFLAEFFSFLDENVGLENTLLVLSSDHGVAMLPEFAEQLGLDAGRIRTSMEVVIHKVEKTLEERWGAGEYIENSSSGCIYYNRNTMVNKGIAIPEVDSVVIPLLVKESWINDVHSRAEIEGGGNLDHIGQLWRNQYHPDLSGDLFLTFGENYIWKDPPGTGHGTPHGYDTHVPLILSGSAIESGTFHERLRTVDVAPTISHLLGIEYPGDIDGHPLDLSAFKKTVDSR